MIRFVGYAFVGVTFGILGIWISDREMPVEVIKTETTTPTVNPGGEVVIRYSVHRRRSCASNTERILYDGARIRSILEDISLKEAAGPLGYNDYAVRIRLPDTAAEGTGVYRSMIKYYCNPLHNLWPLSERPVETEFQIAGPVIPRPIIPVTPIK